MECQLMDCGIDPATREMLDELEDRVESILSGRLRDFRIVFHDGGLVLQGRAPTYYAKQLAQHLVMKSTKLPILVNDIQVS